MQTYRDPKIMAKALRQALAERQIDISHSDALEAVARQLGWREWNTLSARLDRPALPKARGWFASGSRPADYDMGLDTAAGAALIRSRPEILVLSGEDADLGFGTLMQSIGAARYAGQRLRLTGELRAHGVQGAATMWLRADGEAGRTLAFDNMEERLTEGVLTGTTGWESRVTVLDVPEAAQSIHFGFFLRGTGEAWARHFRLDPVGPDVPVTAHLHGLRREEPDNLDFTLTAS